MGNTQEYKLHKKRITDLLNAIDGFDTKMTEFVAKYPHYEYSIDINNSDEDWNAHIKITKHEKINIT